VKRLGLSILFLMSSVSLIAVQAEPRGTAKHKVDFVHVQTESISLGENLKNFSLIYAGQWTFYWLSQRETIESIGSYENLRRNIFSPHFDRDNLENNVINHTWAGATYYLFYRSQGHDEQMAFLWSMASSLAFEFTVETMTERPSYQDLVITPSFGAAVGIAAEKLSLYLHSKQVWPARLIGYLVQPFALLPGSAYEFRLVPDLSVNHNGVKLIVEF